MPDTKRPSRTGKGLSQEVMDLDRRILELLDKRTRLMAKAAQSRRRKKLPLAEAAQERALWSNWAEWARSMNISERLAKKLFVAINSMGYEAAEAGPGRTDPFRLTPPPGPMSLVSPGPSSDAHARCLAVLAASRGQPVSLAPLVFSDGLIELAKGLNQVGGGLGWEHDALSARATNPVSFDKATVFAGQDMFTFLLLLFQALGQEATGCRFSGGPELKLAELGPLMRFLPEMGARLAPIDRRSPGLPARLEAGGGAPEAIDVPDDLPEGSAAALALAAWRFPGGLTIRFSQDAPPARGLSDALRALRVAGIEVKSGPGEVAVSPGLPELPEEPGLTMDPLLCLYPAAMARLRGGRVELSGSWPGDDPEAQGALDLLAACGLPPDTANGLAAVESSVWTGAATLEPATHRLVPLACVLAAAAPGGAEVVPPPGYEYSGEASRVLHRTGKECEVEGATLRMTPGFSQEPPMQVTAPTAEWALALGVLSLVRPGIALDNPGAASSLWPGFWSFFNRLPAPEGGIFARKPEPEQPKRRRIRIR